MAFGYGIDAFIAFHAAQAGEPALHEAAASSLSPQGQLRQEVGKRQSTYEPTHKKPPAP
jgi:hypothetical protein